MGRNGTGGDPADAACATALQQARSEFATIVAARAAASSVVDFAGLMARADAFAGFAGNGSAESRRAGWQAFFETLLGGAGESRAQLLLEALAPLAAARAGRLQAHAADPEEPLVLLAAALMAGRPERAQAALAAHLDDLADELKRP